MTESFQEHRATPRQRSFLKGKLYFNNRLNVVACLIRDISSAGAKLAFSEAVIIPDEVELHIPQKEQTFFARVAWRRDNETGVFFTPHAEVGDPNLVTRVAQLEEEVILLKRLLKRIQIDRSPDAD